MKQSILETEVEKWAREHRYPVMPRQFYEELQAESRVAEEIGGVKGMNDKKLFAFKALYESQMGFTPSKKIEEELRKGLVWKDDESDIVLSVLTPTGVVRYSACFRGAVQGTPNEQNYAQYLDRLNGLPHECIDLFHEPRRIRNWRSKQTPTPNRMYAETWIGGIFDEGVPYFEMNFLNGGGKKNSLGIIMSEDANIIQAAQFVPRKTLSRTSQDYQKMLQIFSRLISTAD